MNVSSQDTSVSPSANVGCSLTRWATEAPERLAIAEPKSGGRWASWSFADLDEQSNRIASGLRALGAKAGDRLALMAPPSGDFIAVFFGMLKAGLVSVLVDPGMGRRNVADCLEEVDPSGFIAIPQVHLARRMMLGRFRKAKLNVNMGSGSWLAKTTLEELKLQGDPEAGAEHVSDETPAAIIFTTGSTGPAKGVLYTHGNFRHQVANIQSQYGIQPGEVDMPSFPLFALFNGAMGVSTVLPDMDFTRPAEVDPKKLADAARRWDATQAFGSPALWNAAGKAWERDGTSLPKIRRVLSAGAPVPPHVLRRVRRAIAPDGEIHTPYGATEALPVASISSSEVLGETIEMTERGAGVCVGRRFEGIRWRVIAIDDRPLASVDDVRVLPHGQIGELMVQGPVVTREYVTRTEANALHKVADGDAFWHRMGDVGYLDDHDRFWYCGRKAHRVATPGGTLYTVPCESIFNTHSRVYRSALVGVGLPGQHRPVILVELWPEHAARGAADRSQLVEELLELGAKHETTRPIQHVLIHPGLPVDVRHNAKIFRERLALWAALRIPPAVQVT